MPNVSGSISSCQNGDSYSFYLMTTEYINPYEALSIVMSYYRQIQILVHSHVIIKHVYKPLYIMPLSQTQFTSWFCKSSSRSTGTHIILRIFSSCFYATRVACVVVREIHGCWSSAKILTVWLANYRNCFLTSAVSNAFC